jgi:hypothetical protein
LSEAYSLFQAYGTADALQSVTSGNTKKFSLDTDGGFGLQ